MGISESLLWCNPDTIHVPFKGTGSAVRLLIVAFDYEYSPGHELTCTKDAKEMIKMAERAGVKDITILTDRDFKTKGYPTRATLLAGINKVAARCQEGDWFVFFFAGHGVNVPDISGDETDGFDEAFVTPDKKGRLSEKAVLVDDVFAKALDTSVPLGVRILCICDCCHSGTICDIDSYKHRHDIYQISASQDNQEAEDTGKGGLLTAALRRAIRSLSIQNRDREFSIQSVFNACNRRADNMTKLQDLSFQWSGVDPRTVAWPLAHPWQAYLTQESGNISDYEISGVESGGD